MTRNQETTVPVNEIIAINAELSPSTGLRAGRHGSLVGRTSRRVPQSRCMPEYDIQSTIIRQDLHVINRIFLNLYPVDPVDPVNKKSFGSGF